MVRNKKGLRNHVRYADLLSFSFTKPLFPCHTHVHCCSVMDFNNYDSSYALKKKKSACALFFSLFVSKSQIKKQLQKLCLNKAAGWGGVRIRDLNAFVDKLCGIQLHLFNLTMSQYDFKEVWATLFLVLVPQNPQPSLLNNYRLVM